MNLKLNYNTQNKLARFIERKRLKQLKKHVNGGTIFIKGKPFIYHNGHAFFDTYNELFVRGIYEFNCTSTQPYIIDCGANMGLSVLYFATKYPNALIEAFEPEAPIFNILQQNTKALNLTNVKLHQKAVWHTQTTLKFFTDNGMGGSVTNNYSNQEPTLVNTVILANYLNQKVAMLKIDIEGAEYQLLLHNTEGLKNVENLFVEYHSYINQEQHLEGLLQIIKNAGFRYHITESFCQNKPFIDINLACENMDMAINIFAYRNK